MATLLDFGQLLKNSYDPEKKALRIVRYNDTPGGTQELDNMQIWKRWYDENYRAIKVNIVNSPSGLIGTRLDWGQVVQRCFDDNEDRMRAVN